MYTLKFVHFCLCDSASPAQHSPSPDRSLSPRKNSPLRGESSDGHSRGERSPSPRSASPRGGHGDTRSYSPGNSDVDVSVDISCVPFCCIKKLIIERFIL